MTRKQGLTVYVLLDASGSMDISRAPVVKGFNEYMRQLALATNPGLISLTTFNDGAREIIQNVPVYEVPEFTLDSYWPCGGTCLANGLRKAKKDLDAINSDQKVLVIITDGQDPRAADRYRDQIKEWQKDGMLVIFLATDFDAIEAGKDLGVKPAMCLSFERSKVLPTMEAAAAATLRFGQTGEAKDAAFTEDERKAAVKR